MGDVQRKIIVSKNEAWERVMRLMYPKDSHR